MDITEDYCRCGHLASHHRDGDGPCRACTQDARSTWTLVQRCPRFSWAGTWETRRRSA